MINAEEIKQWLMDITKNAIKYIQPDDTNVEEAAKLFVDTQVKEFEETGTAEDEGVRPTGEVGAESAEETETETADEPETAEVHKSRMQTMRTLVEFMMEYPE